MPREGNVCVQVRNILKKKFYCSYQGHKDTSGLNFLLMLFIVFKSLLFFFFFLLFMVQNLNCFMAGAEFRVDVIDINEICF